MAMVTSLRGHQFSRAALAALLLVMIALQPNQRALAAEWETVHDSGGILVLRRAYGGSPLKEYRGTRRLPASLGELMALLRDADYNRHWVYRSGGARILEEQGFARAYVHGVVDAPWPLADRDTVVRFDYSQHPQSGVITIAISNHPDFVPPQPGLVRVPDFGGFWRLRPLSAGEVEVTYQVHGHPGGRVPPWLANYAAEVSVRRTLENMAGALVHYRGARMREVREVSE